jgi:ribosomal protein L37E
VSGAYGTIVFDINRKAIDARQCGQQNYNVKEREVLSSGRIFYTVGRA